MVYAVSNSFLVEIVAGFILSVKNCRAVFRLASNLGEADFDSLELSRSPNGDQLDNFMRVSGSSVWREPRGSSTVSVLG